MPGVYGPRGRLNDNDENDPYARQALLAQLTEQPEPGGRMGEMARPPLSGLAAGFRSVPRGTAGPPLGGPPPGGRDPNILPGEGRARGPMAPSPGTAGLTRGMRPVGQQSAMEINRAPGGSTIGGDVTNADVGRAYDALDQPGTSPPPLVPGLPSETGGGITPPSVLGLPTEEVNADPSLVNDTNALPSLAGREGAPDVANAGGAATVKPGTGGPPPGFDAGKWESSTSPKYVAARALSGVQDQLRAIPDEAGRKAFMEDQLNKLIPELEAAGGKVLEVKGEKILFDANDGKGPLWIDTIRDIEGDAEVQWIEPDAGDTGGEASGATGGGAGVLGANPGLAPELGKSTILEEIMAALGKLNTSQINRDELLKGLT